MASFLYIVGGIATVPHPNLAEKNTMVWRKFNAQSSYFLAAHIDRSHPSFCSVQHITFPGVQCELKPFEGPS